MLTPGIIVVAAEAEGVNEQVVGLDLIGTFAEEIFEQGVRQVACCGRSCASRLVVRPVCRLTFYTLLGTWTGYQMECVHEPLEQYKTFLHRPHLFKFDPFDKSTWAFLQTSHNDGSTAVFEESAILLVEVLNAVDVEVLSRRCAGLEERKQ